MEVALAYGTAEITASLAANLVYEFLLVLAANGQAAQRLRDVATRARPCVLSFTQRPQDKEGHQMGTAFLMRPVRAA